MAVSLTLLHTHRPGVFQARTKQFSTPMKPFWVPDAIILKPSPGHSPLKDTPKRRPGRLQMNHSIYSADRSTHRKIVIVALVAGIAVAAFGISARTNSDFSQTAHVVKAGKPVVVTSSDASTVR